MFREGGQTKEGHRKEEAKPRPVGFELPPAWSPDGSQLAVQAHSLDNKDRWIATLAPEAGPDEEDAAELNQRHRLTDPAWINAAGDGRPHGPHL